MIKKITVLNLFNRFNYSLTLKEGINIISGPNGFGKTTILRIIRDILEDKLFDLSKIVFERIELENANHEKIVICKENDGFFINGEKVYLPVDIEELMDNYRLTYKIDDQNFGFSSRRIIIDRELKPIIDDDGTEVFFSDPIIKGDLELKKDRSETKYVKDLAKFYKNVGNAYFLGTSRLFGINKTRTNRVTYRNSSQFNPDNWYETITEISPKLISLFNRYTDIYTKESNRFDSNFLLKFSKNILSEKEPNYTNKDYIDDVLFIQNNLKRLFEYGLVKNVESDKIPKELFSPKYCLVYKLFADNFKKKLMVFDDLLLRLDLFVDIVNNKFLFKKIKISNSDGLEVLDDNGAKIPLVDLSSGEKELVVMYYNLIFNSTWSNLNGGNYKLFLIDEPELSLHVQWQSQVLDDFERIFRICSPSIDQFIVCTHSPQIIGNRWSDIVELAEIK